MSEQAVSEQVVSEQVVSEQVAGQQAPPWAHVRPTNTKAILSVSLLAFAPAAVVFGVLARREIRRTGEGGWGLATWGMGIGIAAVSVYALYAVVVVALYGAFVAAAVVAGATSGVGGASGF